MTRKEAIILAVKKKDSDKLGQIVNKLRFRFGMKYNDIYEFVNNIIPIGKAEWDALLQESD